MIGWSCGFRNGAEMRGKVYLKKTTNENAENPKLMRKKRELTPHHAIQRDPTRSNPMKLKKSPMKKSQMKIFTKNRNKIKS